MKKKPVFVKVVCCGILCTVFLTGCSGKDGAEKEGQNAAGEREVSENRENDDLRGG